MSLREHFLLDPGLTFLNHGSFGACTREVLEAQWRWQLERRRFASGRSAVFIGPLISS
jgi:hypothetical protein